MQHKLLTTVTANSIKEYTLLKGEKLNNRNSLTNWYPNGKITAFQTITMSLFLTNT